MEVRYARAAGKPNVQKWVQARRLGGGQDGNDRAQHRLHQTVCTILFEHPDASVAGGVFSRRTARTVSGQAGANLDEVCDRLTDKMDKDEEGNEVVPNNIPIDRIC